MAQKSIKTKLLQGTLEKSRVKTFTPGEIGEPMFKLDEGEKRIYNRIREHLHIHKAGKQVDEIYLSVAARAIGHLLHNADILSKDGAIMVHPNGAKQVSAEWTAFNAKTKLLKDILPKYNIVCNFLNFDIQGAELKALKGMEEYLPSVDYLYTEVNSDYVYKGCALIGELDEYLKPFGLRRVETKWTDCKWGDAFYMRHK